MLSGAWMLFPGSYRVTLTGSGFDHSYIYARHGLINQETYTLDIEFTAIAPEAMTFTFTTARRCTTGARPCTRWTTPRSPSPASRWKKQRNTQKNVPNFPAFHLDKRGGNRYNMGTSWGSNSTRFLCAARFVMPAVQPGPPIH